MRHVALIGNNLENHLKTVGVYNIWSFSFCYTYLGVCNLYVCAIQIQQEDLIKHDDSWIIVTNRSKNLKFKSPMAPTSLVKFTSWDRGLTNGTVRAEIFMDFIINFLNRMSKYRPKFNCHLHSDSSTLQKRKEIEDVLRLVCINTRNYIKHRPKCAVSVPAKQQISIRQD